MWQLDIKIVGVTEKAAEDRANWNLSIALFKGYEISHEQHPCFAMNLLSGVADILRPLPVFGVYAVWNVNTV